MGLRGGWRDYCIVSAPERSGSGDVRGSAGVGFAARIRRREAVGRSNWDERSRQRDRREGGGATGALTARGRSTWLRRIDGAKRERVGRGEMLVSGLAFVVAKRWDVGSRCDVRMTGGEQPA